MSSTILRDRDSAANIFDTRLTVALSGGARADIEPITLADGMPAVRVDFGGEDGTRSLAPAEACALAAALQAAAVFSMESTEARAA